MEKVTVNQEKRTYKQYFRLLLPLAFCLLTFLTGCVHYDVGVNFASSNSGTIVQHIKLGEQFTSFSQEEAQKWLDSIEQRAKKLQGKSKRISPEEITVTIPFNNGKELVLKFNKFFNTISQSESQSSQADNLDLLKLDSEISINQSNLLFLERNKLNLTVDLRALGVLSNEGTLIVSPGSLIDLQFGLNSPWGAKSIITEDSLIPEISNKTYQLVWQLQPGEINYIEAIFWLPNTLGIGTIFIVLLMVAGFYLKYRRLPLIE